MNPLTAKFEKYIYISHELLTNIYPSSRRNKEIFIAVCRIDGDVSDTNTKFYRNGSTILDFMFVF